MGFSRTAKLEDMCVSFFRVEGGRDREQTWIHGVFFRVLWESLELVGWEAWAHPLVADPKMGVPPKREA